MDYMVSQVREVLKSLAIRPEVNVDLVFELHGHQNSLIQLL